MQYYELDTWLNNHLQQLPANVTLDGYVLFDSARFPQYEQHMDIEVSCLYILLTIACYTRFCCRCALVCSRLTRVEACGTPQLHTAALATMCPMAQLTTFALHKSCTREHNVRQHAFVLCAVLCARACISLCSETCHASSFTQY